MFSHFCIDFVLISTLIHSFQRQNSYSLLRTVLLTLHGTVWLCCSSTPSNTRQEDRQKVNHFAGQNGLIHSRVIQYCRLYRLQKITRLVLCTYLVLVPVTHLLVVESLAGAAERCWKEGNNKDHDPNRRVDFGERTVWLGSEGVDITIETDDNHYDSLISKWQPWRQSRLCRRNRLPSIRIGSF